MKRLDRVIPRLVRDVRAMRQSKERAVLAAQTHPEAWPSGLAGFRFLEPGPNPPAANTSSLLGLWGVEIMEGPFATRGDRD